MKNDFNIVDLFSNKEWELIIDCLSTLSSERIVDKCRLHSILCSLFPVIVVVISYNIIYVIISLIISILGLEIIKSVIKKEEWNKIYSILNDICEIKTNNPDILIDDIIIYCEKSYEN